MKDLARYSYLYRAKSSKKVDFEITKSGSWGKRGVERKKNKIERVYVKYTIGLIFVLETNNL